jgi:hypothetical protein
VAELTAEPRIELKVTLELNETELRALEAIAGYNHKTVANVLLENLGKSYLRDHIGGLYSFLAAVNENARGILKRLDDARAVFVGGEVHIAEPFPHRDGTGNVDVPEGQ